jgi:7-cyano-7-deazaguanine reductase
MADASLMQVFPTPTDAPIVIEHIAEEFTSQCPVTGHPDFGVITIRFEPRAKNEGGTCVELKSLKQYLQSFRADGIFYEAVTDRVKADLVRLMQPRWLQVHSVWRGRGGIRSVIRSEHGEIPQRFQV